MNDNIARLIHQNQRKKHIPLSVIIVMPVDLIKAVTIIVVKA